MISVDVDTTTVLQDSLVMSVSCGSPELEDILAEKVNLIWCMAANQKCHKELLYLRAQLALIELAQGFTRNQIDVSNSRSNSAGQDKYDASNVSDSSSQRTGQSTRCSWADATSFQNFRRDSEDHYRAEGTKWGNSLGTSTSFMYDRARRASGGFSTSRDDAYATSFSNSDGFFDSFQDRQSDGRSGTNFMHSPENANPGGISFTLTPPFVVDTNFDGFVFIPRQTSVDCGDVGNPDWESCIGGFAPSYGRGRRSRYNVSITLSAPFEANVGITWEAAASFRQSFICSAARTTGFGGSTGATTSARGSEAASYGTSHSEDASESQNDAFSESDSERDAETHACEASAGNAESSGESHSGGQREAHGESQSSFQRTGSSKSHSESEGTGGSSSQAIGSSINWSQIFESLNMMWEDVFKELRVAERIRSASVCAVGAKIPKALPSMGGCNPRAHEVSRKYSAPCMPTCGTMGGGRAPRVYH